MSLVSYIPLKEATLRHGGNDIPVVCIKGFSMDIERLTSVYEVWLHVNEASSIIAASDNRVTNAIRLVPREMNEPSILIIDGLSVQCTVKYYAYHSLKHAYLVKIEFPFSWEKVKTSSYEKAHGNSEEKTRFDIWDI